MTASHEYIPPQEASAQTVGEILDQVNVIVGSQPKLPLVGRTFTFHEIFDGEAAKIFIHTKLAPRGDVGARGGIIVYPEGTVGEEASTHYNFYVTQAGERIRKGLSVDYSKFHFTEPEPKYREPRWPAPISPGRYEFSRQWNKQLHAAQKASGFTEWIKRRRAAMEAFAQEQRGEHARLGLDIVHEPEAQELLRVLRTVEIGPERLRRFYRRQNASTWVGRAALRVGDWFAGY